MRRLLLVGLVALSALSSYIFPGLSAAEQGPGAKDPPPWAFGFAAPASSAPAPTPPVAAPAGAPAAPDPTPRTLAGSKGSFTAAQIRDGFGPADWFPEDHPAMPDVVAHGRKPDVRACALCHYPNGKGRPENAAVSGLPYSYFVQTMLDFKNDARKSSDSRKANTNAMIAIAKAMTDGEIKASAEYFSSMKWTRWIRVVETDTVPKTRIAGGMFIRLDGQETEPIAGRIIEAPEDSEKTEMFRDPRSGFVAYVPTGSVAKGEALVVNGGNGRTTACAVCHGAALTGLGPVPGIAGRSPSYTVRQLYDMQSGARKGEWTDLMKPVVANLTADEMLQIAAYLASRNP